MPKGAKQKMTDLKTQGSSLSKELHQKLEEFVDELRKNQCYWVETGVEYENTPWAAITDDEGKPYLIEKIGSFLVEVLSEKESHALETLKEKDQEIVELKIEQPKAIERARVQAHMDGFQCGKEELEGKLQQIRETIIKMWAYRSNLTFQQAEKEIGDVFDKPKLLGDKTQ